MIDQAKNEIREINQKTLFQKAEIKKTNREELLLDIQKSRNYFEEYANEILNNSLSTTLIEMNKRFLDLKLELIEELKEGVVNELNKKIKENYDNYITFLINNIKNHAKKLGITSDLEMFFNKRDYEYFKKESNRSKVQNLFKKPIKLKEIECLGGFKLEEPRTGISYNYIFDDLTSKNSTIFQIELSQVIEDSKIELIKRNFTEFIEKQRKDLKLLEEEISYNE